MNFLHIACKERNFKLVVDCLMEMDIHVDCTTNNNTTPLMLAVRNPISKKNYKQTYNIVEVLLEHGANPNCFDLEQETALHKTLKHIPQVKNERKYLLPIIELLLSHNANPSIKNKDGDACYKMAFDYGSCRIGTLLTLSGYHDDSDCMKNNCCGEFSRYDNASCPSYTDCMKNTCCNEFSQYDNASCPSYTDCMKNTCCNEFSRYDNASCPSYDEVCRNWDVFQVISWQSHHQP